MPDPILIRYKAEGIPELSTAFDTVEKRIVKLTAAAQAGSSTRARVAKTEVSEFVAAKAAEEKAAVTAEAAHTKAVEREAKRRQGIVDTSAKWAGRLAEQQANEEIAAAKKATRALEIEADKRVQTARRAAAEEVAARERVGRAVGGAVLHGTNRVLGGMASLGGMAVGALGAFSLADAVRDRLSSERLASKIANQATVNGIAAPGANRGNIIDQAQAVAIATGMSKEDILKGTSTYMANARSSDFAGAMGNMDFFAKMSKVTGADIGLIAQGAGKLQSQNPALDPKAMQSLLLHADAMSKMGTMSFEQAIESFGKVGSTRTSFAGDVGKNQAQLLGLAQIAGSGGNADEVGTFISALANETHQANKKWKKRTGHNLVSVDATTGQMGTPEEMVEQVLRGTGGNIDKIRELYGRRGSVLFGEVAGSFQAASAAAGGGAKGVEAGIAAVKANIGSVVGAAESPDQLQAEFAQTMSSSAEKFSTAVEKVRGLVEAKLVPYLDKLADSLGDPKVQANIGRVIDALGWLADFFVKNPFSGIGALVLMSIGKDLASAGIGAAVKAEITNLIGGGSFGGGGKGSKVLGVAGALAVPLIATGASFSEKSSEQDAALGGLRSLFVKPTSEKDRQAKIQGLRAALAEGGSQNLNSAGNIAADVALPTARVANALAGIVGVNDATGAEEASARRERIKIEQRYTDELVKQLDRLMKAGGGPLAPNAGISHPDHPSRDPGHA
jgi:hypothetical protein